MLIENPILHFFKYFTILFIGIVFFYLIGNFINKFTKISFINKNSSYFSNIIVGTITSISIYAVYKTFFLSTFLMVLFILLFLFFIQKKEKLEKIEFKLQKKQLFLVLILIVFFSILFYLTYYYSNGNVFGDNLFYANVAQNLIDTGIETNDVDWTNLDRTPLPYHYFEAWFIAFFTEIFSLNTIAVYSLIYVPLFITLIFLGAFCIAETLFKFKKTTILNLFLLSVLFLLIQIPSNPFSDSTPLLNYFYIGSAIYHIKYAIIYVIFQYVFLLALDKKYSLSFYFLLMLVPIYSIIAPAILSGLFVVLIYLFFSKEINLKKYLIYNLQLFFTAIYYVLFYYFQKPTTSSNNFDYQKLIESYVKIGKISIILVVLGLFFIITIYIICKKHKINITENKYLSKETSRNIIVFLVFMSGSIVSVFLVFPFINAVSHDAFQLLSNFLTPIYSLFFFIIFLLIIKNKSNKIIVFSTLILNMYFVSIFTKNQPFSINYIKLSSDEINIDLEYYNFIKKNIDKNLRFAYFRNYEDKSIMYAKPFLFLPDSRIAHFTNHYVPVGLLCYDFPKDKDIRYVNPKAFSFYNFVENQKKNNTFANIEKSTLEFLKRYKIKNLIVEKSSKLSINLDSISTKSIKNKHNYNKFYILK